MATMRSASIATACCSSTTPCGSTGTIQRASIRTSTGCSAVWLVMGFFCWGDMKRGGTSYDDRPAGLITVPQEVACCARRTSLDPGFRWDDVLASRAKARASTSLADAADVFAGAGVDLDHLVRADEQRHAHHRAGFQRGR